MAATLQTLLLLLAVMVIVAIVSRRINVAPTILLVIAGIGLALVPGVPRIELAPEFVLLGILPPLIYSAGVAMSWREFKFNLRPIALLALGCVIFTACAVALAMNWLLGMPIAVAFVLGAIVAPPDAVAPLAIVRQLGIPRRLLVVLDGEIAYGIAIGWLSLRLRRWAGDPRVEITLSLMTPYAAFLVPAHLGGSGVLATVAAGLFVSWNGPLLIPAATRLQGIFFWDLLVYLLEGIVFLVTGLQIRTLLERTEIALLNQLTMAALLAVVVVVVARFVWVYPAVYLPRWMSARVARRDPLPPWQWIFFLAFVGVRGVVSLAAALAVPLATAAGAPFPYRDLILYVTFVLIVVTLVGQGLLLPAIVRALGLTRHAADERKREHTAEAAARSQALEVAQKRLERLAAEGKASPEVLALMRAHHEYRSGRLPNVTADGSDLSAVAAGIRSELIAAEREFI